jgi:hypothetical protein
MQVAETYSGAEYARSNPIPRSQLFNARLELELEKQVAALQLIEVNLRMDPAQVLTELYYLNNCLGTRTFLPVFPSWIRIFPSRIRIKELKYFNPKNGF